jgi:hypothetical protein
MQKDLTFRDDPKPFPWIYFLWCVSGITAYTTAAYGALSYLSTLPSLDTGSSDYQWFTFMKYVNTTWFGLP